MLAAAARIDPELAERARKLGEAFAAQDLQTLLVDYTRLFLGPVQPLARPYASFWLTAKTTLMQDATMECSSSTSRAASRSTRNSANCPTTWPWSWSSCTC